MCGINDFRDRMSGHSSPDERLTGVTFNVTDRLILHLAALPIDSRTHFETARQTAGLIWQAGVSFYL